MLSRKPSLFMISFFILSVCLCVFMFAHSYGLVLGNKVILLQYQNTVSREPKEAISNFTIIGFRITGIMLLAGGIFFFISFLKGEYRKWSDMLYLKMGLLLTIMVGTLYGLIVRVDGNQQGAALLFFFTILIYLLFFVIEKNVGKSNSFFNKIMLLPFYGCLFYTMFLPGYAKLFGGPRVTGKYIEMFQNSFIGKLPGATPLLIFCLGIMEISIPLMLVISLVKKEFILSNSKTWLNYSLILSTTTFGILSFGLAILFNFAGSINLVFYYTFTLFMMSNINKVQKI